MGYLQQILQTCCRPPGQQVTSPIGIGEYMHVKHAPTEIPHDTVPRTYRIRYTIRWHVFTHMLWDCYLASKQDSSPTAYAMSGRVFIDRYIARRLTSYGKENCPSTPCHPLTVHSQPAQSFPIRHLAGDSFWSSEEARIVCDLVQNQLCHFK